MGLAKRHGVESLLVESEYQSLGRHRVARTLILDE